VSFSIPSFKAYDIRGRIPDEINPKIAYRIANATAQFLSAKKIVLGRDIRSSSNELADSVTAGLIDAGTDVIDIGECGTESVYFATGSMGTCGGIMVTASHNPLDYNGFKIVRENAKPISVDTGLEDIRLLAESDKRILSEEKGKYENVDITAAYIDTLLKFINIDALKNLKIVVNPGNGGAGQVIDELAKNLPFELIKLHYDADASFPNGVPNPMIEENRVSTASAVIKTNADMGIAWDGDFDRCFFFDEKGEFIEGYYLVGLLAKSFLSKNQNEKIIYDPRLTWNTIDIATKYNGEAIQSQSGHSFIKQSMRDNNAIYGGEMSAHHYFRDFYYCDSGMIPWLLVAELLSKSDKRLSSMVNTYRDRYPVSGEINRKVNDTKLVIDCIKDQYQAKAKHVDEADGISMEFSGWRFNLRASNTEPLLRLNVESHNDRSLMELKTKELLQSINQSG